MKQSIKKRKQVKKNRTKSQYRIQNYPRFLTACTILIGVITLSIVLLVNILSFHITKDTDVSQLDATRYSKQIAKFYESEEKKEKFENDHRKVQDAVTTYFVANSSQDKTVLDKLTKEIETVLNGENWDILDLNKITTWNGTWHVDEHGMVSFTFTTKEIEPSWSKTLTSKETIIEEET